MSSHPNANGNSPVSDALAMPSASKPHRSHTTGADSLGAATAMGRENTGVEEPICEEADTVSVRLTDPWNGDGNKEGIRKGGSKSESPGAGHGSSASDLQTVSGDRDNSGQHGRERNGEDGRRQCGVQEPAKSLGLPSLGHCESEVDGGDRRGHAGSRSDGGASHSLRDCDSEASGGGDDRGEDEPLENQSFPTLRRRMKKLDPLFTDIFKWSAAALLLLFISFVVFGVLFSGIAYRGVTCSDTSANNSAIISGSHCDTPYGTVLGSHEGVQGYSNCNADYYSDDDSYAHVYIIRQNSEGRASSSDVELRHEKLYSGLQWQCVEYARRYWIMRGRPEPAYFGSVDSAYDIWSEVEVHSVLSASKTLPLRRHPNGGSVFEGVAAPQPGNLLIYGRDALNGFPHGHVAVIVEVSLTEVFVAEQNWSSGPWPGPFHNYSRAIPLTYDPFTSKYTIVDPEGDILGWMSYG